jgi:hypothetical protein
MDRTLGLNHGKLPHDPCALFRQTTWLAGTKILIPYLADTLLKIFQ